MVVNFKGIKVLIPGKELGVEYTDKKKIRNLIGSEIKFIILESDKLTNTAVASRKKAMQRIKSIQIKKYEKGDVIYAKVTGFSDNGVFTSLKQGIDTIKLTKIFSQIEKFKRQFYKWS